MAFVMVLSHSRQVFLRFFLDMTMGSFLRAHLEALEAFGGVPRKLLYDNLKSVVLERRGDAIRFNPILLDFAKHCRFEPLPCSVRRGNEKGRVERAIRYIRTSFFPAREFTDLADLNAQANRWCLNIAGQRKWQQDPTQRVIGAFYDEQPRLMRLPDTAFPAEDRVAVAVGKVPYVRFDSNALCEASHKSFYAQSFLMRSTRPESASRAPLWRASTAHNYRRFSKAISLSGGVKLPLRRLGGMTASRVSSLSTGSARR